MDSRNTLKLKVASKGLRPYNWQMKIFFLLVTFALILCGCSGSEGGSVNQTSSTSALQEKQEKWQEEDASYLGSDDFKEDLNDIADELYENSDDTGDYTSYEESIWQYCMDRWEYYDEIEGGYSGDKYTEDVFEDAASRFSITASEAEATWSKVDKAKLGLN